MATFSTASECVAWFALKADYLMRLQDEERLWEGWTAIVGVLPSAKAFLDKDCAGNGGSVGNKVISSLLDTANHHQSRYPRVSILLLKCCLTFSIDETITLGGETVEKASALVFNLDWSQSLRDELLDCLLLLPLLGASHAEDEVANKYKKMQAEVIGTLAQLLRQIYKSNWPGDDELLPAFVHFPQLPLTLDYSPSAPAKLRLCALLFSFLPKLLLCKKSHFNLQLLCEPWANLLTELVESLRHKFVQDAFREECCVLEIFAWRSLTVLAELFDSTPSLRLLLEGPIWRAGLETLQRVAKNKEPAVRSLNELVKVEVFECFIICLSTCSVEPEYYSTRVRPLLLCCLKELAPIKAGGEMKIIDERTQKKKKKKKTAPSGREEYQQQLDELLNTDALEATKSCCICLKTVRLIFENSNLAFGNDPLDRTAIHSAIAMLVDLSRVLTERCVDRTPNLDWPQCLKAVCETLAAVLLNLNYIIVPLTITLDLLQDAKKHLALEDAKAVDLLIKDLNCMACLSCGPSIKTASAVVNEEAS